jgi:putative MATE family efflux protein
MSPRAGRDASAVTPPTAPDRLLEEPPLRAVVRLAAPTTLVMAVSAVSNVVYTIYVSRIGVEAIGAVSLVFPVSLLALTSMGGGIGAGAASAIARAHGAARRADAAALAGQALLLCVVLGVGFGILAIAGSPALFRLMGASGAVHAGATQFARVLLGGIVITFFSMMLDSIMRGEGNVRIPALWSVVSLVLQMLVTPFFMFTLGWGLPGGAIAMLACHFGCIFPRLRWVFGGHGLVRPTLRPAATGLAPTREILRVGIPAAVSTSINNIGLMALTAVVTRLGEADLAAYGLGTRLDFVLMSFGYGVGAGVLTLVGMATGARRPERVRAFTTSGVAIAVVLLSLPGLLFCWQPALWLGMFTADPGVHAIGAQYFRIIGPTYPLLGVSMVVAFAFQGLGRATLPLAVMVVRVAAVLLAAVVCTHQLGLGERAVFGCIAAGNVLGCASLVALFVATERRLQSAAPWTKPVTAP